MGVGLAYALPAVALHSLQVPGRAGVAHALETPSGMQSGIKLIGPFAVPSGGTVELVLDFDAEQSIHSTGNGKHILHPVISLTPRSG